MSDQFLDQQINLKFCMKLGMNASDPCTVLPEAYWGEAVKKSSVFECYKQCKEILHVRITDEDHADNFLQYQGYCPI